MNHPSPPGPNQAAGPPAAAYPIRAPGGGADPRFTVGLALEVADVLARHGYPVLTSGHDLAHWQHALFTTIYHHGKEPTS